MSAYIAELGLEEAPWRWALAFDYSPAMVQAIKDNVPSRDRKWCPEIRQWWFKPGLLAVVQTLAERHCGAVHYIERDSAGLEAAIPAATVAAYRALHLQPSAPDELVKAAYRILAKRCHPDAGGDTTTMQAINSAYSLISARSKEEA